MLRGLETSFLVQAEVEEHPGHQPANARLDQLIGSGDTLVLAPQVLAEFVHIVTDPRRFSRPLSLDQAISRVEFWWFAKEVVHAIPDDESFRLFLSWLREHGLGRKRLLDTLLAAIYFCHGVRSILTTKARDFGTFGVFDVIVPES